MQITKKALTRFLRCLAAVLVVSAAVGCDRATLASAEGRRGGAAQAAPIAYAAHVVGITDGDTLTVLDGAQQQHRIRLAEVDAPEHDQPWGARSKAALSDLAFDRDVSIQQTDTDRYGRTVAIVFADGRDINREMVATGAAWAYRRYLTDQTLVATEARARSQRLGLWSLPVNQTVAPWEWRKGSREPAASPEVAPSTTTRGLLSAPAGRSHAAAGPLGQCGAKRYCREMTSCAEARFYLEQCGVSTIDGDADGRPCENVCGH